MALDELSVPGQLQELWPEFLESRRQSEEWENWALGQQTLPTIPDSSTSEFKELQKKSITPWTGLIVQSIAQALDVEGYRTRTGEDSALWEAWQVNRMDSEQAGLYEAALTTGVAYLTVLPDPDSTFPEWRPYSSAQMTAFYESPFDEWPVYAIFGEPLPKWQRGDADEAWRIMFLDNENVYHMRQSRRGSTVAGEVEWSAVVEETMPHRFGVCPVVRYVNRQTLKGRAIGEVEPHVAVASRIDQTVFDRLVVQRYASWNVRYATGLADPMKDMTLSEEQRKALARQQELMLKVGDVLVTENSNAKFGSLPATPLDGHLRAAIDDIRMLASVSQTPPQLLTGDINNVSAEALAAIEASFNRKVAQRKQNFGEAHEQAFRLTASIIGVEPDDTAQVIWRDMESRSLAQTADALGKLRQMLEIPPEVLWDHVPFLNDQDRQKAKQLRDEENTFANFFMNNMETEAV